MFIYNHDLYDLPEQTARGLIDNLDDGFYIQLLSNAYRNWCNVESSTDTDDNTDSTDNADNADA